MNDTLGSLKVEVREWMEEETLSDTKCNSAINDGIESLWMTLLRATVSMFVGGPISLSIESGTEGVILVSIVDPTVAPVVSDVAASDAALASHTVDVAYTFVTESGSETMLSPVTTHTTGVGLLAAVHPPTLVTGAMGWNLYARSFGTGSLVKQNEAPLEFLNTGGAYVYEPETGYINDPGLPQPPTENTTGDDICFIKHLEAQMPDQGWKAYDSVDIHSLAMRRLARNVASSSEYQGYAWDLVNQRQLEFRPQTATAWSPRYFYIKRPRRLRYDNAPLPFLTVPSTAFLRYFAMSRLSITIREYEAAKAWAEVAEAERTRLELAVLQMNSVKNEYITQFG